MSPKGSLPSRECYMQHNLSRVAVVRAYWYLGVLHRTQCELPNETIRLFLVHMYPIKIVLAAAWVVSHQVHVNNNHMNLAPAFALTTTRGDWNMCIARDLCTFSSSCCCTFAVQEPWLGGVHATLE